ncbi:hypothetical protein [Streptomyces corynorhini]|nr:hypothetical protein [Streptomyces corynorhini]
MKDFTIAWSSRGRGERAAPERAAGRREPLRAVITPVTWDD